MKSNYLLSLTAGIALVAGFSFAQPAARIGAEELTLVNESVANQITVATSTHGRGTGRGIGTGRGKGIGTGRGRVIGMTKAFETVELPAPKLALRD